jgi:hypothetical protein
MTVSAQTPINDYIGNGSTKTFPYDFKITKSSDMLVYVNSILQSTGYAISGINLNSGGNVTFITAPGNGLEVKLKRAITLERTTDYLTSGPLEANTLDDDIDRVVMMVQDINSNISNLGTPSFLTLTDKPTTLSGYGITDAASLTHNHDATYQPIGSYSLSSHNHDASYASLTHNHDATYQPIGSYLTANQNITLSGDITGSGTTAITATLATVGIGKGGTGQTTANAAFNALAPSQSTHSGKYLTTDGTNTSWATVAGGGGGGDAYLANTQTFTGANTFTNTTKATRLLVGGGGTVMDAYINAGFNMGNWAPSIETYPPINDYQGNWLMFANNRGYTITTSGSITSPNDAFGQGNTFATITNVTQPIVIEITGPITADTNVNAQRVFLQAHGALSCNLKVDVQGADDVWVELANEAISLVQFQYWFSQPVINVAAFPSKWNIKGVRYTITSLGQAMSYIRQLGWYKKNSFFYPWMVNVNPTYSGQTLAPNGTAALPSYSFNNNSNSGIYLPGSNIVSVAARGLEALRINGAASAVNYLDISNAATGSPPVLLPAGTDANISLHLRSKGTGDVRFMPGGTTTLACYQATSAVNFVGITPAATGGAVSIAAQGTDANVPVNIQSRGTGALNFFTNSAQQFRIANTTSAVNYVDVSGGATGTGPTISSTGSDANVRLDVVSKGTGTIRLRPGNNAALEITPATSAVNYVNITNAATTVAPSISVAGSDTNVGLALTTKGTGDITFKGYALDNLLSFNMTFEIQTGANATFTLNEFAGFKFTINSARFKTDSGTITANVQINGTSVTGLSAMALTSTQGNATASAANTVVAGNRITLITTSNATAVNAVVTLACKRVV